MGSSKGQVAGTRNGLQFEFARPVIGDIGRVFYESQLRDSGYLKPLQMRDGELRDLPGLPWRFDGVEGPNLTEAPVLGQHNEYVYQELLGLSLDETNRLVEERAIY